MMDKIKNAFDKSVASVSVKSNVFIESSKITTQINSVQEDIAKAKADLAQVVYIKWQQNVPYNEDVTTICMAISSYEAHIAQLNAKIEQIKLDSRQILGDRSAPTPSACANCGSANAPGAKFCFHCGMKINE